MLTSGAVKAMTPLRFRVAPGLEQGKAPIYFCFYPKADPKSFPKGFMTHTINNRIGFAKENVSRDQALTGLCVKHYIIRQPSKLSE